MFRLSPYVGNGDIEDFLKDSRQGLAMKKNIIVVHPGQQHSFRTATAVKEMGCLYRYITTVYDARRSFTRFLRPFLGGHDQAKVGNRRCDAISDGEVTQYFELLGLVTILIARIKWLKRYEARWDAIVSNLFARRIVRFVKRHPVDVVIYYDGVSRKYIDRIKKARPNVVTIMDVSIALRPWIRHEYKLDMQRFHHKAFYTEDRLIWDDRFINKILKDVHATDYFLAASHVVRRSLEYSGIQRSQILVLPYGVDTRTFTSKPKELGEPIRLVFTGQINYRKGLHYFLECIAEHYGGKFDVTLIGRYDENNPIYRTFKDCPHIHFMGFVLKQELPSIYEGMDYFVLPSLAEGMSLAGLEALSCGLPLICSDNSGVNDVIVEGRNGFVFCTGDVDSLRESLDKVLSSRNSYKEMRAAARMTGERYTWDNYALGLKLDLERIL